MEAHDGSDDHVVRRAFHLRGYDVVLAAWVAEIFGVETREIVQNIKENNKLDPPLFPERYAFQLSEEERYHLRSTGLIPKPKGRGGSRALPWAVTRKGTIRLATIMKGARAVAAADRFIDIFDDVIAQVQASGSVARITPSQLLGETENAEQIADIRRAILKAVHDLLKTEVDPRAKTTVEDELRETVSSAIDHVQAWLRGKKVANEKIQAETLLILEQAQDIYERRRADLEDRRLDQLKKRIEIIRELRREYAELENNAIVDIVNEFGPPMLPPPKKS